MGRMDDLLGRARDTFDFLLPAFIGKGFYQYAPRPLQVERQPESLTYDPPLISIVIPSYNQARFLEQSITSVLDQEYPNLELIIVDGGSTDGSLGIIKTYESNLHWWCSEPDKGQADAINKGFSQTNGEILAWLNADDCYYSHCLLQIADWLCARPDVDVVYGNRLLIDEMGREVGRWILPPHNDHVLTWADFVPQETLFWRRALWEKVDQRLDASLDFAMDWDLLLRFRDAGAHMVHLPHFLGLFRVYSQQKTSSKMDQIGLKEMQELRLRCLGYVPSRFQCAIGVAWYLFRSRLSEMKHNLTC